MTNLLDTVAKPLATDAEARKVMSSLTLAGCDDIMTWFQDGPGDSIKIDVTYNGKKFTVAVEQLDNLPVMDPDYIWTYGIVDVAGVIDVMEAYVNG